ncbi:MAG: DUF362 domain-containing protein [Candidatus Latescibacteria bacterium]|nr:DUF362 domain-containing protein [Candidatus Latescibacterota bacterium]
MWSSKARRYGLIGAVLVGLVVWDISSHQVTTFFIGPVDSAQEPDQPLQVEGMPLLRPGTLTLGQGQPTVAVAASNDAELPAPAALDASLSADQVDALVRRALDLDQSGRSIRDVVEAGDWVLLKVNIVTNRGNSNSAYFNDGFEHPGQITDLRVVRSVIGYLVDNVGPRRITIAEGGAESPRKGEPGFPTNAVDDGWSVTYPEFDDLSYLKILEEFGGPSMTTQVDTTDLNYTSFRRDPVPGGAIQRLGVRRLDYDGAQFGFHQEGTGSFRSDGYFMPEPILDADKVISIAAMKTTIYGTTLGIKNYVGTLASGAYGDGTSKRQHYQNNPEHGYLDLFSYNPAAYTVIEGLWGTEGDGPQWGQNVQHNVVVVGADPVATEAVANIAMGFNPLDLEALYLAAAKGFGTLDLKRIEVAGRRPETVQHHFVKSRGGSRQGFFYGRGIRRWLVAGPFEGDRVDQIEHLPAEADLRPQAGGQWQLVEHLGYSAEVLDLGAVTGQESRVTNYAFSLVQSARDQEGFLWLGYDERARIWLNGELIFENPARNIFALAQQKIPIRLQQGENRLLFKIGNFASQTLLAAHVVDEDGDRLPGIEFGLPGDVPTAVESRETGTTPEEAVLLGNYPNPFNPATTIRFSLERAQPVRLDIYDTAGQRIRTLATGTLEPGHHRAVWDGRDRLGYNAASGVYFAVLQAGEQRLTSPMALMR